MYLLYHLVSVEGLETNIILPKEVLIHTNPIQQFSFRKPSSPPYMLVGSRWHTLLTSCVALCKGKLPFAFDLAMLTAYARQNPLVLKGV